MEAIHFFRAGNHTTNNGETVSFSQSDLEAIAAAYDPRTHEAPIVIGHPKTDAPAYGWVDKVIAKPDGLYAIPRQLNAEFSELVKQGAYKKISGAFYPSKAKSNPKPGAPYLRHIGFLGAEPPAIKGLNSIQFSEAEALFFAEEDRSALREHSIAVRERAVTRREAEDMIQAAFRNGRVPIGLKTGVLAFCEGLDDSEKLEFSEDGQNVSVGRLKWFADFVSKLPVPVHVGEICTGEFSETESEFEMPPGYAVSSRSAEVHASAQRLMREKGIGYGEAVRIAETSGFRR